MDIYPFWRFEMWTKGYGTYFEIDAKANSGELIVGKEYPDLRHPATPAATSAGLCPNCGKDYFVEETIVDGELRCSCARR
jgi:hypothetical protein